MTNERVMNKTHGKVKAESAVFWGIFIFKSITYVPQSSSPYIESLTPFKTISQTFKPQVACILSATFNSTSLGGSSYLY